MQRNGVREIDFDLVAFAESQMQPTRRSGKGCLAFCPFHDDSKKPSLLVNKDYAYCFACGKSWPSWEVVSAVTKRRVEKRDLSGYSTQTKKVEKRKTRRVNHLKIEFVRSAARALQQNDTALNYMVAKRGVDAVTLMRYNIGLAVPPFGKNHVPRLLFPVFGPEGGLLTASYRMCPGFDYIRDGNGDSRYLTHVGTKMVPFNIRDASLHKNVVYVGGQIDALTLLSAGIPAVGSMGEGVFKEEWAGYFAGTKTFVLLDNDTPGYLGAQKAADVLGNAKVVFWPKDAPDKCDVNSAANDRNFGLERIVGMLYDVGFSY